MNDVAEVLKNEVLAERFAQQAPAGMLVEAEVSFASQHLSNNPYLMKVANQNPKSLLSAMSNVAACGLSLNPSEKQAYLVPRKGAIYFDPSYVGLIRLATNSGSIEWVQAYLVYETDTFRFMGAGEKPVHEHDPFKKDRGEFRGVYCVAKTKTGDYLTTAMSEAEVLEIRDKSEAFKSGGKGPWKDYFEEMAKKTVIRRAFKTWTRTDQNEVEVRLAKAVNLSNENEGIAMATGNPTVHEHSDEQKAYFDQLIEKDDSLGMCVMQKTTDTGEFTNLYNSFEKGSVTKYKRIVDGMLSKGHEQFLEYVSGAANAQETGDDIGLEQLSQEVSEEAWELILGAC
jgi:phage RecT family recombinase